MIKRAYYYLFYKFYKFSEAAPSRWLSDWKAELAIDGLLFFLFFSLMIYYNLFIDRFFKIPKTFVLVGIYFLFIGVPNYFIFHHRNQWKKIVDEFDELPKRKNLIGGWIVLLVVIFIITNLIFSLYLTFKVDWRLYN